MSYPLPAVIVDPQGVSTSVAITDKNGNTPTVYSDQNGVNTISLPSVITARTKFYMPGEGPWTFTPTANGEVTSATTLILEGAEVATVTVGSSFTAGQWSQLSGAYVSVLAASGDTTGATDGGVINAALSAAVTAGGGVVKGKPGATYYINAPIVTGSNVVLDMTACTIIEVAGSTCNMLNNQAVANVTRILNAAMTSGSAVLTDTTDSPFTAAMVGKAITVQGAGTGGAPLTTTVLSYQSATQVTLNANAATTVTGQYAAIGPRDSNITVIGGTWNRGANGDNSVNGHNLRLRHVDGLTIRGTSHASTSGKYGVNYGDCTQIRIEDTSNIGASWSSDLVHGNGPLQGVIVKNSQGGTQHDDLVSFTARDSTSIITDCAGDITDVEVDGAQFLVGTGSSTALKLVAGKTTDSSTNYKVARLRATNLTGPVTTGSVAFIGDSSNGTFDDITIEGVRSLGGTSGTNGCVFLNMGAGSTVDRITLKNLRPASSDGYAVSLASASVARLTISDVQITSTLTFYGLYHSSGTISRLVMDKIGMNCTGGVVVRSFTGATISQLLASNWSCEGGMGGTIQGNSGATISRVSLHNIDCVSVAYPLGIYNNAVILDYAGVTASGNTSTIWLQGSAYVAQIIGANGGNFAATAISGFAGGLESKTFGFPIDVSSTVLVKNTGDMAYNTNGSLACGVGPVGYNGTHWYNAISAAVY